MDIERFVEQYLEQEVFSSEDEKRPGSRKPRSGPSGPIPPEKTEKPVVEDRT